MVREGHEVASHGWSHGIVVFASPRAVRDELDRTTAVITRAGSPAPRHFRTPHGFRSPSLCRVARRRGYTVVGWTAGVFDTARPGAAVIAERTRRAARPGAILLLHDADGNGDDDRSQTADALPAILADLRERGLETVTVAELTARTPPRNSPWLWRALLAGLFTAAIGVLVYRADAHGVDSSVQAFRGINPWLVGLAIVANVVSVWLKAYVWEACLRCIPERPPVKHRQVLAAVFVGFFLNSVLLARAGEPGRAVVLRRRIARESGVRVPLGTIAGTIVTETVVLSATLAALLTVMMFTVDGVPLSVERGVGWTLALLAALVLAVAAVELIGRRTGHPHAIHLPGADAGWLRHHVARLVHDLRQGQQLVRAPLQLVYALAAGFGSWIANLVAIWLTLLAFGVAGQALAAAVVVFAVSNLVGTVQVTPGNVGVFQAAIAVALTRAYAVEQSVAISFGVGLQAIEFGLGAICGSAFLLHEGLSVADVRAETGAVSAAGPTTCQPS
jgi:uncharacterized protein (TIRG00374 family)